MNDPGGEGGSPEGTDGDRGRAGPDRSDGDRPTASRRDIFERVRAFLLALAGTSLPVLAIERPPGLLGWLLLALGALAMGWLAAITTPKLIQIFKADKNGPAKPVDWSRRWRRILVLAGVVATTVAVSAVVVLVLPSALTAARVNLYGCPHPLELRVLTSPGSLRSYQQAAGEYERWAAARYHGCVTVRPFVYSAPWLEVGDSLRRGWPDSALVQRPRPDVWLVDSGVETNAVLDHERSEVVSNVADSYVFAAVPLVLGVPEPEAAALETRLSGGAITWDRLWTRVRDNDWGVLRPEPASLPVGQIATAAIFGSLLGGPPGQAETDSAAAEAIEHHIASSIRQGRYPAEDVDALLCRYRLQASTDPEQVTTVVLTAQEWLDYRQDRLGVGPSCGQPVRADPNGSAGPGQACGTDRQPPAARLVAFYPSDTLLANRTFVQFEWDDTDPQRSRAAAEFGRWLREEGQAAIQTEPEGPECVVGAIAVGTSPDPQLVAEFEGFRQDVDLSGRLLVLLDTSGSMAQPIGPDETRIQVAREAVTATLDLMVPDDEFGLWTFAGSGADAVQERVPVEVAGADPVGQFRQRVAAELEVGGATPLFRAISEGVTAVGGSSDTHKAGLVVITDGLDSGGGLTADDVEAQLRSEQDWPQESPPQVFVIAVGEASCTEQLTRVTGASGGQCLEASFDNLDLTVESIARAIWRGDDDDR